MKKKVWIIGSFVAASSLIIPACGDEKEDTTVKSIAVTPATVTPLEVGGTVELTAAITPASATEAIKWVSEKPDIVSVAGTGTKVTLTAVSPGGPVDVYATNQAGVLASNKVSVTVNQPDYAGAMEGKYSGTGTLDVTNVLGMNQPISGVKFTVAREGDAKVKLTIVATVFMPEPTELTIVSNEDGVVLSPGTAGIFALSGRTEALVELEGLWFTITGTFNPSNNSFSLKLVDDESTHVEIDLTATKD